MISALRRRLRTIFGSKSDATRDQVEQILGEDILDFTLYKRALQHKSTQNVPHRSYERLEFLGDAVLELIISEHLYKTFPYEPEGFLTVLRSKLVRGDNLASVALSLGMDKAIMLSEQAEKSGLRKRRAIMADTYESLLAALYLDRGLEAARRFVRRSLIEGVDLSLVSQRIINFKSQLQEYTQARNWKEPIYHVLDSEGPPHQRVFRVSVTINGKAMGVSRSNSIKKAEQKAAEIALKALQQNQKKKKPVQPQKKAASSNPKNELQTYALSRKWPNPIYKVVDQDGPSHAPIFTVQVTVNNKLRVSKKGPSKKKAGQNAAREALSRLQRKVKFGNR